MRKTILTTSMALMMVITSLITAGAEEVKITGSASVDVFNKYIFRGYELSTNSIVIQPALSISYSGFSAGFWGNIDSNETATQSFVPDRDNEKSFNETDITLSYTHAIGKLSLTGGYIYYGTKYATETEEVFAKVSYDMLLNPTLSVYRDITSYPGTYVNLAIAHSFALGKDISLDLAASAGYFAGDDDSFKTSAGTGEKYSAFHDGMVRAGLSIPVFKNTILQPNVQYWLPLSDEAKRHDYNPNGHLDETVVVGLNITSTF